MYHRGTVTLVGGRATVELPEHFTALADPQTITVQLTPRSFDSEGVAAGVVEAGRFEIRELRDGKGRYDVDFIVHALRTGYEDYKPVMTAEEYRDSLRSMARSSGERMPRTAKARAPGEVARAERRARP